MDTLSEQIPVEREPRHVLGRIEIGLFHDGAFIDVPTHWLYEDSKPYEIAMSFPSSASDPTSPEQHNVWTLSRENLHKMIRVGFSEDVFPSDEEPSVEGTIGEGDVIMYTKSDWHDVFIFLRTDAGFAHLKLGKPELALFLNQTFRLVPLGQEWVYQQLEIDFDLLKETDQSP